MSKVLRFADLFAGIGGIRLGFEAACGELGIKTKCVFSSEINPNSQETYKENFGELPSGDIREVQALPEVDVVLGGFPCQTFSYAGKRMGFGDTRGTLFFEIERLISIAEKKPKLLILENVRGLITHDNGRTLKTILKHIEELGYGVEYLLLNSSNFGVPQNRMRIYIVAIHGVRPSLTLKSDRGAADSHKYKSVQKQINLFEENRRTCVSDILENRVDKKYLCSEEFSRRVIDAVNGDLEKLNGVRLIDYRGGNSIHSWDIGLKGECTEDEKEFMSLLISNRRKKHFGTHQDGKRLSLEQCKTFYTKKNIEKVIKSLLSKGYLSEADNGINPVSGNMSFEVFKFLDPNSISITLVSSDSHKLGVVHKGKLRRITPRECARLQSFPDSFKIHPKDSLAYFQFGNSVTVKVVTTLALDILKNNKIA